MSTGLHYDIVVIGSGPAGQEVAIQGAKAGKRVAVIERKPGVDGSCVHRGTWLNNGEDSLLRLNRKGGSVDSAIKFGQ